MGESVRSGLGAWDWVVLGAYFALLAGSGAFFAWRAKRRGGGSAKAYFLAESAMPVWAVAISILATAQSAATFTGAPEAAFAGDLTYLGTNLGGMVAAIILASVFIPAYYRLGVGTPYQLLERRFGSGAKLATSWAYMIGRVFASGSRVYVGAIPVALALYGQADPASVAIAVAAFMAFGIVYTLAGGITSVIWTDVIQVCVYLGAAIVAIVLLASKVTAPWSEVLAAWRTGGPDGTSKLTLFTTGFKAGGFDWSMGINLVTILTGFVLLSLASHGTDQDLVQRMLTCHSPAKGSWSVISGVLVGIPAVAIFMVLGLLLWIFYTRPELMGGAGGGPPPKGDEVVLRYILDHMPAGAAGLMIAGVMAAGPAGINSGLNSMASTFVTDVYRPANPGKSDEHYVRVSRIAVVGWGVVLGLFALVCVPWREKAGQSIIGFVLSVMTFAYAGLLGVFFTALFTRRGSSASAVAAMITGFVLVLLMRPEVWAWWTPRVGLPVSWQAFKLGWTWPLVIGTGVAMLVCCLGKTTRRNAEGTSGDGVDTGGAPVPRGGADEVGRSGTGASAIPPTPSAGGAS